MPTETADLSNARNDDLLPLEIENDTNYRSISEQLQGRRIVNLGHILQEYEKIIKHPQVCTMGRMNFVKETRLGLVTRLHFFCDNCERSYIILSEPVGSSIKNINSAAVWGSLSVGIGHNQCEELLGILDVPFLSEKCFLTETVNLKHVSYRTQLNSFVLWLIFNNTYNKGRIFNSGSRIRFLKDCISVNLQRQSLTVQR